MPFSLPHERIIWDLEAEALGKTPNERTSEEAYQTLKWLTQQDFGYDGDAWREWFKGKSYLEAMPNLGKEPPKSRDNLTE